MSQRGGLPTLSDSRLLRLTYDGPAAILAAMAAFAAGALALTLAIRGRAQIVAEPLAPPLVTPT